MEFEHIVIHLGGLEDYKVQQVSLNAIAAWFLAWLAQIGQRTVYTSTAETLNRDVLGTALVRRQREKNPTKNQFNDDGRMRESQDKKSSILKSLHKEANPATSLYRASVS